jgi:hypothetical protein
VHTLFGDQMGDSKGQQRQKELSTAGVEDGTHLNARLYGDRPVHEILCGIAKV